MPEASHLTTLAIQSNLITPTQDCSSSHEICRRRNLLSK